MRCGLGLLSSTVALACLAACASSPPGGGPGSGVSTGAGGDAGEAPSDVVTNGYLTAGPWAGSGFTATDPGAATIIPDCSGGGCNPAFAGNDFCMHGTVTGRTDFTGFAMLGWNLSQSPGGPPGTWAVPDGGGVTVAVTNVPPSVALRVQLQGINPHDSSDRWCAALTSGRMIPWSAFKTNCWAGGTPQSSLAPGTPLQQGSVIVPGLQADLPFDVCLVDLQLQ